MDKVWLMCLNKCSTIHGVPYVNGVTYYYDLDNYIDGLKGLYYPIFDNSHNLIGYQDKKFINDNFVEYSLYLSEEKYIEDMFNFFMDNGIKLKEVKLLN